MAAIFDHFYNQIIYITYQIEFIPFIIDYKGVFAVRALASALCPDHGSAGGSSLSRGRRVRRDRIRSYLRAIWSFQFHLIVGENQSNLKERGEYHANFAQKALVAARRKLTPHFLTVSEGNE